jgi:hypothetical protein
MKKLFLIIVCSLVSQMTIAQEGMRHFDFIISIDGDIIQTLTNPQIVIKSSSNTLKAIAVSYHPGNLSISQEDFNMLPEGEKIMYLKFDYSEFSTKKGEQETHNYEIEIGKNWFEKAYMIIKVYNTCKKQNKKLEPLEGKTYTFDLDYAGGQMIRVRKK